MIAHIASLIAGGRPAALVAATILAVTAGGGVVEAAETFTVTYRCAKWKTVHFEKADKAKLHYDTVKKLGCEVKQDDHGGHTDVSYRCREWKTIALKDHDAVHRWEKWLKAAGFETQHTH